MGTDVTVAGVTICDNTSIENHPAPDDRGDHWFGFAQGRTVLALVRRARQRLFHNDLMAQAANAASAALIAFILLLFLGTQVLDWRWTLLVTVLAVAGGWYRARKRLPSLYRAAQIVDHRLQLADTLSTALYFSESGGPARSSQEMRELQLVRAGKAAETADVRQALPYTMPRAVYLLLALVVIAGSLFGLRYGLSRRLDLQMPLASMLPFHFGHERTELAKNMRRQPPQNPDPQDDSGASVADPDQTPTGEPDPTANDNSGTSGDPSAQKSGASKGQAKPGDKGEQSADAEQEAQAEGSEGQNGDKQGQQGNKQDAKQNSGGKQESGNGGEGSSLMSKMKDAFQNLLSSVRPPQTNPSNQQQNSDPNNQQGKGQQNGGKQQQGKDGQKRNNGNPGDSQDGQTGEQAQSPQDPQGKGNGKSDSQQASKQPGSGVGNQDGDKSIKQAEALAAMGKISEIIGKRSANITGEATVEVQSTSQQLHTPYAQRTAQHAQNGTQISRDEVPVAVQPYVQQYFEQVRKQATPVTAPAKK